MNIEELREYCLQKKGVTESFPFDNDTLVFKVADKLFLLTNLQNSVSMNVKCDPERAIALREEHEEIKPGYHMNKAHWNTVNFQGKLTIPFLKELIDHSYELVYSKLPKAVKESVSKQS